MPLPLFSTEASGFPPLRRIRDSGNFSQPFAGARQNGIFMPPLALFGAGSSANSPRAEETEKRVRTARGRGCEASRRPPAHMQFGEPFATVCRCAAERNMHATACPVRSRFIGEAIRPAGVAVLSCLEQARRHIRRTGGGGLTGRHAVAGRGYLSRLKS